MQIDMHIHTKFSDGEIDISRSIPPLFSKYSMVSFTDHENIFDPTEYPRSDVTKFISGVEISCNHNGFFIEILGYNFDANHDAIVELVNKVKKLRVNTIKEILSENRILAEKLPDNPFRLNTSLPKHIVPHEFWNQNNNKYRSRCHSVPAKDVIKTILDAGGTPVLAHPMASLSGREVDIEQFILSLNIDTIELVTPKHTFEQIAILQKIILQNSLSASIGSDSHEKYLNRILYPYNTHIRQYDWLNKIYKN